MTGNNHPAPLRLTRVAADTTLQVWQKLHDEMRQAGANAAQIDSHRVVFAAAVSAASADVGFGARKQALAEAAERIVR